MDNSNYISVSELNAYIKSYLENNYFLNDVYVKGEISNFKRHQSGTFYFSIKDENSAISIVMFPSFASKVKVNLKDGDLVLIHGKINVYEARGQYNLLANEVIFDSKGMLLVAYEELKAKLLDEGLFDTSHKISLPKYPKSIGLITAPYGAAIQDMYKTIHNRWPLADIYIFPTLVQGENAKYDITKKIMEADNYGLDVLICGRGGGSIEDLWPFNEEMVARAFYACETPIISAVGHEIDTVITDYVADARGLTPTDGAVKATPNIKDELVAINDYRNTLNVAMNHYLSNLKMLVERYKTSYVLLNPSKIYENYRLKIDELETTLENKIKDISNAEKVYLANNLEILKNKMMEKIHHSKEDLKQYAAHLDSLSPLKVLNRGYSFITANEKVIKSIEDVNLDENLSLNLKDGKILAKVIEKENHSNGR